ncbi:flagellin hook IN motif-containing protein, partial [Guyparkeria sp. 1SP6A2]|nr:flagellin hook IN motif-containing protein [Guyparkeria sp. 1SP6A2]
SLTFSLAEGAIDPITVGDGSTLEDMRDAINTQSDGRLSASIINDGEGYRLSVNATETGAAVIKHISKVSALNASSSACFSGIYG